jgi:hypothetical protein
MPQVFNSGVEEGDIRELALELAFDVAPVAADWMAAATRALVVVKDHMPWGAANRPSDLVPDWETLLAGSLVAGPLLPGLVGSNAVVQALRVIESGRRNRSIDDKAFAWGAPDAGTTSPADPARIQVAETLGYLALQEGAGNCQYQASAVFLVLNAAGVSPVDLIYVFGRDGKPVHGLCVIGIPRGLANPRYPDPAAWARTAVLADPWQNEHGEPASSLLQRYPPATHVYQSYARNAPV